MRCRPLIAFRRQGRRRRTTSTEAADSVLVEGGVSFNVYRLLDISVNAGTLLGGPSDSRYGYTVGIPLADYFAELTTTSSGSAESKTGKSG